MNNHPIESKQIQNFFPQHLLFSGTNFLHKLFKVLDKKELLNWAEIEKNKI